MLNVNVGVNLSMINFTNDAPYQNTPVTLSSGRSVWKIEKFHRQNKFQLPTLPSSGGTFEL